jgi:4-hydroxybenzoate polyprenyltransferase
MKLTFSNWMGLARGANMPTVWTNVLAAWAINAGTGPSLRWMPEWTEMDFFNFIVLGWLLIGSTLIYAGGCFLNDACDHKFDRQHRPERPIPSGDLTLSLVWFLGIGQMALGAWSLIAGAGCSWEWTLGLFFCILAYDWIHKKTAWGILLMGGCRSLLWITAGTAASGMSPAPLLYVWAIAVGAYVVGISWYARTESKASADKKATDTLFVRIPILLLFIVPLISLAYLVLWNNLDPVRVFLVNLVGLLAAGIAFFAILQMREDKEGSVGKGVSKLLAGICVVDATALSFHAPLLVGPCVLLGAIAHILQKKFAAT